MARPVPHWLDDVQQARYAEFKEFVSSNVEPFADDWEREQTLSKAALSQLAASGWLGATLPVQYGGKGWDAVTFGLLNEAFGKGSPSLTERADRAGDARDGHRALGHAGAEIEVASPAGER